MKQAGKPPVFIAILFWLFIAAPFSYSEQPAAKVFFINLTPSTVDVRLQYRNRVEYEALRVKRDRVTRLEFVREPGDYSLYFRKSDENRWYLWTDTSGIETLCPVLPGRNHCIVMAPDGSIQYITISEPDTRLPRTCFFNASSGGISAMELGRDWGYRTAAASGALRRLGLSGFFEAEPGEHAFYWGYEGNDLDYFTAPDGDGPEPRVFRLEEGNYYIFLVRSGKQGDYPLAYDITPHD